MITIPISTKSPLILKPGEPLAALCIINLDDVIDDLKGTEHIFFGIMP
jgi:hypothetical protein